MTVDSERAKGYLDKLASDIKPAELFLVTSGILAAAGLAGKKRLKQLESQRAEIRERQLRIYLRRLKLRVSPISECLDIPHLWSDVADIETRNTSSDALRRRKYPRTDDGTGQSSYQDWEWMLLTTHRPDQQTPPQLLGLTRYVITGEIDPKRLSTIKHDNVDGMAERQFGRTMLVEAASVNHQLLDRTNLTPNVVTCAGFLGALDFARRYNLSLLFANPHQSTGDRQSFIEQFRARYFLGSVNDLATDWRQLAVIAKFGGGYDPNTFTSDYFM